MFTTNLTAKKIFINYSELEIYSNLYNYGGSALSNMEGYSVVNFLTLEMENLAKIKKHFFSITPGFANGGTKLGFYYDDGSLVPEYKSMDYLDPAFNFFYMYKQKYNFLPFIAYNTPFKTKFDKELTEEITLKHDRVSLGAFSPVKQNFALLALDYNLSTYKSEYGNGNSYQEIKGGLSFRGQINVTMDKKRSFWLAASTPVYYQHDLEENVLDERVYFPGWIYNGGVNFWYTPKLQLGYRLTYREFNDYIDTYGDKVTYPWVMEHGLRLKYKIRSFYIVYVTYDLIPSSFYRPKIMREYKHQTGFGLFFKHQNFSWNMGVIDSGLFSEDVMSSLIFKLDLNYEL